eukprot:7385990-Prymnesium_polylepis.1
MSFSLALHDEPLQDESPVLDLRLNMPFNVSRSIRQLWVRGCIQCPVLAFVMASLVDSGINVLSIDIFRTDSGSDVVLSRDKLRVGPGSDVPSFDVDVCAHAS